MTVARNFVHILTVPELRLIERGLPTDRQAQDTIALHMVDWLEPALDKVWDELWQRLLLDFAFGRIQEPPPEQVKAIEDTIEGLKGPSIPGALIDEERFWQEVAGDWAGLCEDWAVDQFGPVADYQGIRYNFYADMNLVNQAALRYTTETYVPNLISIEGDESIVRATRNMTVDILARWQRGDLPGGRGLPDLERVLMEVYGPARANRIATTEATRIYSEANQTAWINAYKDPELQQAAGISTMRWQTARDEFVCPICRPLNGTQVLITQEFPVPNGRPPAHVNCRCWITPVKNYNPAFHPPAVPTQSYIPKSGKVPMSSVRKPTKGQIEEARVATGAVV